RAASLPGEWRYGSRASRSRARRADGDALRADRPTTDGPSRDDRADHLPWGGLLAVLSHRLSDRSHLSARHRPRGGGGSREGRGGMRTVLHTESSPGLGGQEIRTLHEARWTAARGWRVILAGRPDGRLVERAQQMGIEAVALPMNAAW